MIPNLVKFNYHVNKLLISAIYCQALGRVQAFHTTCPSVLTQTTSANLALALSCIDTASCAELRYTYVFAFSLKWTIMCKGQCRYH